MAGETNEVVEQAVGGDGEALCRLLERYGPEVRARVAARIASKWRSILDADDVMQVTYLEAFLQIDGLRAADEAGFAGWLQRIADHNLRDAIKELTRQKRPQPEQRVGQPLSQDSYASLLSTLDATSGTPSRFAARREYAKQLESALGHLPDDYARVVRLYDLEQRPVGEVADAMGRSVGAVYMLRQRAHERLRCVLGSPSAYFSDCA